MADDGLPLSDLNPAGALDGTELAYVVKSGASRSTTTQAIADLGGGGGGGGSVANIAALEAVTGMADGDYIVLSEAGREGTFIFDGTDKSAFVTADPAQGVYVAPASDPDGSSGAWVRKFDGPVNVKWFGAIGDDTTDDSVAFLAALAYLKATARADSIYFKTSKPLLVPLGAYYLASTTLDITHSLTIEGEGSGRMISGNGTKLRWDDNCTGLRYQDSNTTGVSGTQPDDWASTGSILRKLHLEGGYAMGTTAEGDYHAIHLKVPITIEEVGISDWQGDGVYSAVAVPVGNSNGTHIYRMRIIRVRNGFFIDGSDTNVWHVEAVDVTYARRWGFFDSSFLGNHFVTCHTANCGIIGGGVPTVVSYMGNWYGVVHGQEAWCSTNAPSGTTANNQGWIYFGVGGPDVGYNVPAWANPITVRSGGGYITDNANAQTVWTGCYSEGGQSPSQFPGPALVISGLHGAGIYQGNGWIFGHNGSPTTYRGWSVVDVVGNTINSRFGSGASSLDPILFNYHPAMTGSPGMSLSWSTYDNLLYWTMWHNYGGADAVPIVFSGYTTSAANAPWGTARANFPQGFGLAGKKVYSGTAAPVAGAFLVGDMVINSAPSAGEPFAWRCISAGSPGTWEALFAGPTPVTTQSGTSYTAALTDASSYIRFTNAAAISFTLPQDSDVAFPIGTEIEVEQVGAGALSFVAGTGATVNSRAADLTLAGQFGVAMAKKVAANTWTVTGDL